MSKRLPLTLAAVATLLTLAMPAQAEEGVAAIVNGDKILTKDVTKAIDTMGVKAAEANKLYPMVLEQIINEKLIEEAVAKAKVTDTEDYKKRLEVIKVQLAKQMYIENALKADISDKAVKAEYEKFKKENKGKTEVHARHILVPTEAEANSILATVTPANFADMAKKFSKGPSASTGGELGWFRREAMIPEFASVAFSTTPGTVAKTPVKTQFGWHVILVEERNDRYTPPLETMEQQLRQELGQTVVQGYLGDLRKNATITYTDGLAPAAGEAPAAAK